MNSFRLIKLAAAMLLALPFPVRAYDFGAGNLVVTRVGDGVQVLTNTGNTVFIDEFTTNGALVNSITLPDTGPVAFLLSGQANSEGGLTRSMDRKSLALAGYNTNRASITGSLSSQSAAAVPRAIASVDASGNYALLQTSTTVYSQNNIRCAATDGTNNFWTAGANGGTFYFNPPQPPITIQNNIPNTRYLRISGSSLYFSTQGGVAGIYGFQGGGLPKGGAVTNLLFATGAGSNPVAFDINPAFTIAYVADQRNTAGGIQRWTNSGAVWSLAYILATGAGAFGLAADFSGSSPVVWATTDEASSNRLVRVVDTGPSSSVVTLATAGANRWFRGVAFAPESGQSTEPVSLSVLRTATNVIVSWPVTATGYSLQGNSRVDNSNGWTTVLDSPVIINGSYTVPIAPTNAAQFYRLKR